MNKISIERNCITEIQKKIFSVLKNVSIYFTRTPVMEFGCESWRQQALKVSLPNTYIAYSQEPLVE
jgi:hypothetical protein